MQKKFLSLKISGGLQPPQPPGFYCPVKIVASAAAAAALNRNDIKTLSANGLSTFHFQGNQVFSNGPKSLPRNSPDCQILCN